VDRKWIWASLAIVAMWAAVVLVGVYGPDVVVDNDTSHVKVPALAIVVALCAFVATLVVAWRASASRGAAAAARRRRRRSLLNRACAASVWRETKLALRCTVCRALAAVRSEQPEPASAPA
jgi:hypothetical protein